MTTRIIVCLIALSVGIIQLFRGDYLFAMLSLIVGIIFLISIVHLSNKFDDKDEEIDDKFIAKDKDDSYDNDENEYYSAHAEDDDDEDDFDMTGGF